MSVTYSKPLIFFWIIMAGGIFIAVISFAVSDSMNYRERKKFQPFVQSYLEKPQNPLVHRDVVSKDSIVISGKLIVVNLDNNRIDPVFNDLPERLKPQSPEQVKTILWVKCKSGYSDQNYSDGKAAMKTKCDLAFIDFVNKKFLWRDTLTEYPSLSKNKGAESTAPDPSKEILRYIEQIAQKD